MECVLLCECANADVLPREAKQNVAEGLAAAKVEVCRVRDLCRLAADRDPALRELAARGGLAVIACHPRAVRWLLHAAGCDVDEKSLKVFNLRRTDAQQIIRQVLDEGIVADRGGDSRPGADDDAWPPWFPVIDYERCGNCKQCLNFCLFGVYELSADDRVTVANPRNCKNNCPACARICPDVAIIFPKLAEEPLNGAEVRDEDAARADVKINMEEILGADVYGALAERSRERRGRLLKKRRIEQAQEERAACSAGGKRECEKVKGSRQASG
jgi:NAD-dependent dihydropyrimidine dehydrogenase PreA subunit